MDYWRNVCARVRQAEMRSAIYRMLEIERQHILCRNKSDEMPFAVTKRESRWSSHGILSIPHAWIQ
jgi:hypothetical protein